MGKGKCPEESDKSASEEDNEAHECGLKMRPADSLSGSDDRSAYSSLGNDKQVQKNSDQKPQTVFQYENLSSFDDLEEEKASAGQKPGKRSLTTAGMTKTTPDQFPDSEKEDEEGSEGIDEGFLQVASAGSCNTGSNQDETRNNFSASNQDEAAMFSFQHAHSTVLKQYDEPSANETSQVKAQIVKQNVTQEQQMKTLFVITKQF